MRFSFILPAWKGKYLSESVSSILAQTYTEFELVIVDDCSPDNLKEIVCSFHDARISYHRNKENIGGKDLVAQWNHCLQYAHGDYVILATDDDLYETDFLDNFSKMIDKYPEADLLRSRIVQVTDSGEIIGMDDYYKEHLSLDEKRYTTVYL
jgi:glycosyltransferase involved in cell wall biosynthesis